jgi:hypothetical protein
MILLGALEAAFLGGFHLFDGAWIFDSNGIAGICVHFFICIAFCQHMC